MIPGTDQSPCHKRLICGSLQLAVVLCYSFSVILSLLVFLCYVVRCAYVTQPHLQSLCCHWSGLPRGEAAGKPHTATDRQRPLGAGIAIFRPRDLIFGCPLTDCAHRLLAKHFRFPAENQGKHIMLLYMNFHFFSGCRKFNFFL